MIAEGPFAKRVVQLLQVVYDYLKDPSEEMLKRTTGAGTVLYNQLAPAAFLLPHPQGEVDGFVWNLQQLRRCDRVPVWLFWIALAQETPGAEEIGQQLRELSPLWRQTVLVVDYNCSCSNAGHDVDRIIEQARESGQLQLPEQATMLRLVVALQRFNGPGSNLVVPLRDCLAEFDW